MPKLCDKTKWNQLTENQQANHMALISKYKGKHGSKTFHSWMSLNQMLVLMERQGFNRKLTKETLDEIFWIEDGIIMGERR